MYVKIVAQSVMNVPGYTVDERLITPRMQDISGLCANVCYSDGYTPETLDKKMEDTSANIQRFSTVIGTNHHSIADHACITVYLGGISKMLAMLLNSLEYYTTSERSARYTDVSKTVSGVENELYNKWKKIISDRIAEVYPSIDEKRRIKLGQENARYFISVFNKTTSMVYTTTFRQWSYIPQWVDRLQLLYEKEYKDNEYLKKLLDELVELKSHILSQGFGDTSIEETKDRYFRFLANFTKDSAIQGGAYINDSYKVKYSVSLACLAQAQRHRTIEYFMDFDGTPKKFYVPEILSPEQSLEWLDDMNKVKHLIPQGTKVDVVEMGTVDNFLLKCKERLCGRAQLEIAKNTAETLRVMSESKIHNPALERRIANAMTEDGVKAKCELVGICKEPCEFGACGAVNRLV